MNNTHINELTDAEIQNAGIKLQRNISFHSEKKFGDKLLGNI
jgi:hypothetical protein